MDPVTGIGLAASVIQLVTFSLEAVTTCREVYEQGSTSEYKSVDYTTKHLADLTKSMRSSIESSSSRSQAFTREEKDLIELGRKCEGCAGRLQHELRKLQIQPRASALDAVWKSARAVRKAHTIKKIQEELARFQAVSETSLLNRLSQKFDVEGLRNNERFSSLDVNLKYLITCLAKSQTSLPLLVKDEANQTREYMTSQIDRVERLYIDDRLYQEVTKSLFYPDIFYRQEQIDHEFDGIETSYDWIFDEKQMYSTDEFEKTYSKKPTFPAENFAQWLKSGHGVYWISGKAGSGKSTLMSYIHNDERRLELLKEWCPEKKLLTPTFFFWNAGSFLNKSIDGLLRSLIYQMLAECQELIYCFKSLPLHAWTQKRLLDTLSQLLTQTRIPLATCMLVDGLDEFEGRYHNVIKLLNDLAAHTNIKICLSSRPLLAFEEAFAGKPSMKLQELTSGSIQLYADFQLSGLIQQSISYDKWDRDRANEIYGKIVRSADGVFLWAVIAIRKVRDGLHDIVNMDELAKEVDSLPLELEGLYELMLNSIGPAYRKDAAHFLQIILSDRGEKLDFVYHGMDLCRLYLTQIQRLSEDMPFSYVNVPTSVLVFACRILKSRLLSHTAGLLELTPSNEYGHRYGKNENYDPILITKVTFFHKTARDFLLHNDEATSFLTQSGCTKKHVHISIARGILAQIAQVSPIHIAMVGMTSSNPIPYFFRKALRHIALHEGSTGVAQTNLMQSLDYEIFARGYLVKSKSYTSNSYKPYMVTGAGGSSVDVTGMAAEVGMKIYVSERAQIPLSPLSSPFLPGPGAYACNRAPSLYLSWVPDTDVAHRLHANNYRQHIVECLRWKMYKDDPWSNGDQMQHDTLAATYLLSCCSMLPMDYDLVQALLRAGANPMAEFLHPTPADSPDEKETSFWHRWLHGLLLGRYEHMRAKGTSRGISTINGIANIDSFDITKALISNGADIDYRIDTPGSADYRSFLKRRDLEYARFELALSATAIFTLEECFNSEPEFRAFATEVKPLTETPTRRIKSIIPSYRPSHNLQEEYGVTCEIIPSTAESDIIWPLVERWEETGYQSDLDALVSTLEDIWRTHIEEDIPSLKRGAVEQ